LLLDLWSPLLDLFLHQRGALLDVVVH